MKVCQVVPCFPYKEHLEGKLIEKGYHVGGVERHTFELSTALIKRGHDLTIVTTKSPSHEKYHEIEGIKVLRIPYGIPLYSSSVPYSIFKDINLLNYDIVHAHTPNPTIADLACLKNKGKIPFVLTYHNDVTKEGFIGKLISSSYNKVLGDFLLNSSDLIIATTLNYAEKSLRLKTHRSKIRVVPNGTNLNKFHKCINGNSIRKNLQIPEKSKVILFVGALEEYKGLEYLLKAFQKTLDHETNNYLILVGSGKLGTSLKQLTNELQISNNVIFIGYAGDGELPYYYSACDIFVLPSISEKEGFGIVQLEAMACNKPVICTDLPGVNEVDKEEVASIHVPPKDIDALANAMIRLIGDEILIKKMGEQGRMLVEKKYDWDKIAEMTEKLYIEAAL